MKKLKILTVMLVIVAGATQILQAQTKQNKEIFINRKGEIHDHGGTKLGYIDKDDIVRDNQGRKIYFIDKNGNVIDANGKNLGKARKDGSYYNLAGQSVITTKDKDAETCEILDAKGHSMGTVHKNYKLHACAAHCYFITEQRAKKSASKKPVSN